MEELVSHIAKALVDEPEAVTVTRSEDEECITMSLAVASGDLGKVIGKQGRTVRAMRSVLSAVAEAGQKRTRLEIVE
ncbi:MAG: RNA-binding protein [Deltaproteobacteria bacterium]|nr:MAG: RNA-binding protein [Deltaproteobacteria bacterium]